MNAVFADTAFFGAFLNPRDRLHVRACIYVENAEGLLVTTEWVLLELADFLSESTRRLHVYPFVQDLRADPTVRVHPAQSAVFNTGLRLYAQRPDKAWSLTDCLSFVTMQEEGITEALTTDHHFTQAGYKALLL